MDTSLNVSGATPAWQFVIIPSAMLSCKDSSDCCSRFSLLVLLSCFYSCFSFVSRISTLGYSVTIITVPGGSWKLNTVLEEYSALDASFLEVSKWRRRRRSRPFLFSAAASVNIHRGAKVHQRSRNGLGRALTVSEYQECVVSTMHRNPVEDPG